MAKLKAKALRQQDKPGKSPRKPDDSLSATTGTDSVTLQKTFLTQVRDALWLPDWLTKDERFTAINAAGAMLRGIAPRGEIEGMLAAQMVATHSAAMECLRRAMNQKQSFVGRDQNLKFAAKLLSIYTRQVEVLDKHRGKGQQKVIVEYVNVEAGGQAMVGHVETGTKRPRSKRRPARISKTIAHAPEAPVEIPAADKPAVALDEDVE